MLHIHYENRWGLSGELPPSEMVRLDGGTLKHSPESSSRATLETSGWVIDGRQMHRIEIVGPLLVHFEVDHGACAQMHIYPLIILFGEALFADAMLVASFTSADCRWHLEGEGGESATIRMWSLAGAALSVNRERIVSTCAYELAKRRNFQPGHELDDWLATERQIDTLLRAL